MFFFFFSSRRRHTRWNCDWSSDVCSSDLWPAGSPQSPRPLRVGVLLEGTSPGVAERAEQMSGLLAAAGGATGVAETAPARWGSLPSPDAVVRVSFWVSALGSVLEALIAAGASAGVRLAVTGSAG